MEVYADMFFGIYLGNEVSDSAPAIKANELEDKLWSLRTDFIADDEPPVEVVTGGGMSGLTDTSLAISESRLRTNWDKNPITLPDKLEDPRQEAWSYQLTQWCERLGVGWDEVMALNPEGPRWILILSAG